VEPRVCQVDVATIINLGLLVKLMVGDLKSCPLNGNLNSIVFGMLLQCEVTALQSGDPNLAQHHCMCSAVGCRFVYVDSLLALSDFNQLIHRNVLIGSVESIHIIIVRLSLPPALQIHSE
jgi:hypothetical protein